MKDSCVLGKAVDTQKFGCAVAIKGLLFMLAVLSVLNPAMLPPYGVEIDGSNKWPSPVEERQNFNAVNSDTGSDDRLIMKLAAEVVQSDESVLGKEGSDKIKDAGNIIESAVVPDTATQPFDTNDKSDGQPSFVETEKPAENKSFAGNSESSTTQSPAPLNQGQDEVPSNTDSPAPNTGINCEFSDYRYNMCSIEVNVRVIGSSATVLLIPSPSTAPDTNVWKIRPFTRKWEDVTMARVREFTIQWAPDQNQAPACDVTHDVPILIFSTEGFPFNPFHDYTDLLIPIFLAAKQYNGEIQFGVTNFHVPWINKYQPYLQALSHYPLINLDSETLVHCFPSGQIGLRGTGPITVDPSFAQHGYTMQDFRHFMRTSLSLERAQVEIIEKTSNKKPRIAILLRKGTRTFTNEDEIIEMAQGVGFEVARADTETTKDFPRFAHIINSCDVLMGLHGAGLTNMLYLPNNGTVLQVIPWGDLKFISWKDYGEPTKEMGLNYVEYEIKEEESTLIEKYPRNHTVFTNPQELHKQGWMAMYTVYLVEQSVKLDVNRFRGVLVDLFNSLTQQ
ncbi:hypothetical protein LUZ62_054613 [Rhynchospora pubera]|uniref:Glycosyltransferase 61 catalytic domain-containing protein n=1 Tax=Rhynchospora pubera TaxID=906938 RepID=A0AAV8DTY5_9POAL|nr:hypothetical protein LUZ62_054613 [Rhynchospora pubera]